MHSLEEIDAAEHQIGQVDDAPHALAEPPRRIWPRVLRVVLLAAFAQYMIIVLGVGLSLAATLRY